MKKHVQPDISGGSTDLPAGMKPATDGARDAASGWITSRDLTWGAPPVPVRLRSGRGIFRMAEDASVTASESAPESTSEPASRAAGPATQSAPATSAAMLVDDDVVSPEPGLVSKSRFLTELETAICAAAEHAFEGTRWTADGCPWIGHWFRYYHAQSAAHVEAALRRYAPEVNAVSVHDYIPAVTERVRRGIVVWKTTGRVTELPEKMPASTMPPTEPAAGSGSGSGAVQAMGAEGGAQPSSDPASVAAGLGAGSALGADVAGRMGSAFGTDFSDVRIHTDDRAAELSLRMNARAFTVGNHVAFARGAFHPGSPSGDGLIAHELAHVVQQRGAGPDQGEVSGNYGALESDAEHATVAALGRIYGAGGARRGGMPGMMRGGLALQRCRDDVHTTVDEPSVSIGDINDPGIFADPQTSDLGQLIEQKESADSTGSGTDTTGTARPDSTRTQQPTVSLGNGASAFRIGLERKVSFDVTLRNVTSAAGGLTLKILGNGDGNGRAAFADGSTEMAVQASGKVGIVGKEYSAIGKIGGLSVAALVGGVEIARSTPFSVQDEGMLQSDWQLWLLRPVVRSTITEERKAAGDKSKVTSADVDARMTTWQNSYDAMIIRYARERFPEFDPAFIGMVFKRQIGRESQFRPKAQSDAHGGPYIGMMQVGQTAVDQMYDTWLPKGERPEVDLTDPEQNIKHGISYVYYYYSVKIPAHDQKNGWNLVDPVERLKFALGYFNGGETKALEARKKAASLGKNPDLWDDVNPYVFEETRKYVAAIMNFSDTESFRTQSPVENA